jgi:spore germination cell wall hydrolase CwlJ-like protein
MNSVRKFFRTFVLAVAALILCASVPTMSNGAKMVVFNNVQRALAEMTVVMEAANQGFTGMLGVAYVIVNRQQAWQDDSCVTCWKLQDFSCWTSYTNTAKKLAWFEAQPANIRREAAQAVLVAEHHSMPDPTHGALYFMNERIVRGQHGGELPEFWASLEQTATIKDHSFFKPRENANGRKTK